MWAADGDVAEADQLSDVVARHVVDDGVQGDAVP
jgi:hypothetical protein